MGEKAWRTMGENTGPSIARKRTMKESDSLRFLRHAQAEVRPAVGVMRPFAARLARGRAVFAGRRAAFICVRAVVG